jgi:glycolate oxidase iron-sulfur subunit
VIPAPPGPDATRRVLPVSDDDLVACVACGLCLPHCPTWRVTGEEPASPRGRITAMRAVQFGGAPLDDDFARFMELCVQCRACEAACPSSVPFGRLMEGAREVLATRAGRVPLWQRAAYEVLGRHRLLVALSRLAALAQRAGAVPRRLALPRLPVRSTPLRPTGADVWLFTGCVMDAWMRPVHAAVVRVLAAAGVGVALPDPRRAACCGALHAHAGLTARARELAVRVTAAFPGDAPVLVDAAGCGAALKDYGRLLGTPEAAAFAARVLDVHEFLASVELPAPARRFPKPVAVVDPCHLRHVQRAHPAVRAVLAPYADVVELDDEGACCGAGGAYAVTQPAMAGAIRERKVAAIRRAGASVVASANPGCMMWLGAAGIDVRHPIEIVDDALRGGSGGG